MRKFITVDRNNYKYFYLILTSAKLLLDIFVVKILLLNQWWQITIMFIVILASSSALADRVQVNKNKISDLFEKEIDDKQATLKFIENSQKQSERGISSKGAVQELGIDENELEGKASELNAINVNNLESQGQEERAKEENSYINQLEVDYLDPKIVNHKRDIDKISDASSKLMSRLMEGLRDLDIDCKTVKGDKELEPEYVIEIEKEHFKDTIYNQKFCEELRNRYSCVDGLTLQCVQFSEKPAELTISQSSMKYTQNIAGLVKRISFVEQYGPQPRSLLMSIFGGDSESSSYGGTVHGFINKASGTTYHAREATWHISFNISSNVAMLAKIQLTDVSYGTFIMFKLNGQVIFVGPANGNNLFLNGHRSVETKGKKKYAGKFGKRMTVTTNYPIVSTGFGEYALGLDSIAGSSRVGTINLLPYIKQGDNILEIKAIGRGSNEVRFNLGVSERICTYWQENWHEQCRLE